MTEVMMMLGQDYQFALSTAAYSQLRRSCDYRWPAQDRLGRLPARQFVGPGNDTIELEGVIYPHFKGGLGQIDTMREIAGNGAALRLVDGRGANWGRWCLQRLEETRSVFFANGDPRRIEFSLTLGRYGEEK